MELNTIKDAFDRVTKKQKLSSSKSQEIIEQISQEIEQALSSIGPGDDIMTQTDPRFMLCELKAKLKEIGPLSQLEVTQKELNVALSKYPKLLEKSFNPDISKAYRNIDFDIHTVNQIIASHFYREGHFDLGDCFVHEAREPEAEAAKSSFAEMYQILEAMKLRNLEPALKWAATNHDQLNQNGSDIELKLHRLQFVEILQKKRRDEALNYAKTFLAPFAKSHMAEFQKLMGCLLWAGKLDASPYAELLSPVHWDKLSEELTRHFCNLMGQSFESPLSVTVAAGGQGLPTLLKLMNVMTGKKQEWQSMKQLPVPVDLDREFQFHSVFVCPVSRDQASEENPPMLLSCGHVLCKQSITKLSKSNSTRPFKCPYCPSEVEVGQCRQLYF
ncbi:protein RMD5 homolog [Coffea eugenioides]|uniref:Protein RMD5 homolog n=1 Tax=Coffea arabica TaxID=13443 RepID=A0A6P6THA4_COFAR|nr:protein RMD5 homolog [Coffea eugenioides]XP_027179552.1 protein RMD5 homolog [Coffea eugenioides]XP_027179553.1 protein RMD5 homolog [Coffea eugenioides]